MLLNGNHRLTAARQKNEPQVYGVVLPQCAAYAVASAYEEMILTEMREEDA